MSGISLDNANSQAIVLYHPTQSTQEFVQSEMERTAKKLYARTIQRLLHPNSSELSLLKLTIPVKCYEMMTELQKSQSILTMSASKPIFSKQRISKQVLAKAQNVVNGLNKDIINMANLNDEVSVKLEEDFLSTLPLHGNVHNEQEELSYVLREKLGITKFHIKEISDGGSGAKVYGIFIPDKKGKLAYIMKTMEGKTSELAKELSSLQQLTDLNCQNSFFPIAQTAGNFTLSQSPKVHTIFVQTAARGQSFSSLLEEMGQAKGKDRGEKMDVMISGLKKAAKGLAELHLKNRLKAAPVGKEAQAFNLRTLKDVYNWLKNDIVSNGRIPLTKAELDRIYESAIKEVDGNWGISGFSHGDTHLDNLFFDPSSLQFTFIDTPSFVASIDAQGSPIGFSAFDFAWTWGSISDKGFRNGLSPKEVETLQNVFMEEYDRIMGDAVPPKAARKLAMLTKQLYFVQNANQNQAYLFDNAQKIPNAQETIQKLQCLIDHEVASIRSNF